MFYRSKVKSTSSLRTESCAHKHHSLYPVQSSLVFMVDSTGWMRDRILNLKLSFSALLLLFLFWLALWTCANFCGYLFSVISKSFWCFKTYFPWIPHLNECFKKNQFFFDQKSLLFAHTEPIKEPLYDRPLLWETGFFFWATTAKVFSQLLINCWCVICHL